MTSEVFFMVLLAAFLHAIWNGILKVDGDRLSVMAVIAAVQGVISVSLVGFVPVPNAAAWPFLFSAALLHTGYRLFLLQAYRFGDLSRVYPIARGSAPLIVAVLAVIVAGEHLSAQSWGAILVIAFGIMSLALTRGLDPIRDSRAVLLALGTGCFAAAYTVIDGLGARNAGSPHSYLIWVFLLDAPVFFTVLLFWKRDSFPTISLKRWVAGTTAGAASYVAYWLVIWALSVAPMASVSALRATSILFAVLFGVVFLKEPLNVLRTAAVTAIAAGVTMLKLSK